MRLSLLVVFSSAMGSYASQLAVNATELLGLIVGGFLITGASNAFNQVYEKRTDAIMKELKTTCFGKMSALEGAIWVFMGVIGISGLIEFTNELCALCYV